MSATDLKELTEDVCGKLGLSSEISVLFDPSKQPCNSLDLELKLLRRGEGAQRVLTLLIDQSKEVTEPCLIALPVFAAKISAAICEFWSGSNAKVAKVVRIC